MLGLSRELGFELMEKGSYGLRHFGYFGLELYASHLEPLLLVPELSY